MVATRSADRQTLFLKAVNPGANALQAVIPLDGDFTPKTTTMRLIRPLAMLSSKLSSRL